MALSLNQNHQAPQAKPGRKLFFRLTPQMRALSLASLLVIALGVYRMTRLTPANTPPISQPGQSAVTAFTTANQYAKGKNVKLAPLLSKAYQRQCTRLVGMLPVAARIATRGGTVTKVEPLLEKRVTADSIVVSLRLTYEDGKARVFDQAMVNEDGWKIGYVITHGVGGF